MAIHIATEGPLGLAARRVCLARGLQFTTSYHTRFPEYLSARWPLPEQWSYAWLRRFHGAAARTLVGTPTMRKDLRRRGFRRLVEWSRGVDSRLFHPRPHRELLPWGVRREGLPVLACVGRVAVEKNIEAFLALDVPAHKVVIGDGPALERLRAQHPAVTWLGYRQGEALAEAVAQADCLVFPSRTDTFGLVMLEAMSAGVPVAAFPVTGPLDVVRPGITGVLDEDLAAAVRGALQLDRRVVRSTVLSRSWAAATAQFMKHLAPVQPAVAPLLQGWREGAAC
jgi:glycosyltransferase involved in cell wall biosynthesis